MMTEGMPYPLSNPALCQTYTYSMTAGECGLWGLGESASGPYLMLAACMEERRESCDPVTGAVYGHGSHLVFISSSTQMPL